eukprot:3818529-Rhodomonas_salina.1
MSVQEAMMKSNRRVIRSRGSGDRRGACFLTEIVFEKRSLKQLPLPGYSGSIIADKVVGH